MEFILRTVDMIVNVEILLNLIMDIYIVAKINGGIKQMRNEIRVMNGNKSTSLTKLKYFYQIFI